MKTFLKYTLFILFPVFLGIGANQAQPVRKIEIVQADEMSGINKRDKFQKLLGHVILKHEGYLMYCDSADWYSSLNYFKAYGHIKIVKGDSLTLKGNELIYDGNDKHALITGNVVFQDRYMTLKTGRLHYQIDKNKAWYDRGATIVDTSNTLTSQTGYYLGEIRELFFKKKVKLTNPDFTLECDTLQYNLKLKTAYFKSPTIIRGKDNEFIYTESGWYDTRGRKSLFKESAHLDTRKYFIAGNWLYYENETRYARARQDVLLKVKEKNIEIHGHLAEHFENLNYSYVTDSVLFVYYMKDDTLYLSSDTLKILHDTLDDKNDFLAYQNVLVYSSEMQMKCDSLVYSESDSSISLYGQPVIWNKASQITAKNIRFQLDDEKLSGMDLKKECLMIEKNAIGGFNQVSGLTMKGYFKDGKLESIDVNANAKSIYFLEDDQGLITGISQIESSFIQIVLKDKKVFKINFITEPSGVVDPPGIKARDQYRLEGFRWREDERPHAVEEIFTLRNRK